MVTTAQSLVKWAQKAGLNGKELNTPEIQSILPPGVLQNLLRHQVHHRQERAQAHPTSQRMRVAAQKVQTLDLLRGGRAWGHLKSAFFVSHPAALIMGVWSGDEPHSPFTVRGSGPGDPRQTVRGFWSSYPHQGPQKKRQLSFVSGLAPSPPHLHSS
ncbi:hypothetical protein GWK47_043200 [Chionoecetes opilio]|uniref:Uncharacterized protein n=1 Tax=Chionoecetes opilio TaxID=41210 RepID=A0A8J4Y9M0_CHIOP|nr:hypothetical protein GWK47_043200 [Chionoecetes opilio]